MLVIGIMESDGLTNHVGFWTLFQSIMHIASVAVMFITTILLIMYSLHPKLHQLVKFAISLAFHGLGCVGNLALLWVFSVNDGSNTSRQFSLIGTVVPGLIDGIMFAVIASIYCNYFIG